MIDDLITIILNKYLIRDEEKWKLNFWIRFT